MERNSAETVEKDLSKKEFFSMSKNVIQFQKGFINLPISKNDNTILAMSVASEVMQFGFVLNIGAIEMLTQASREDVINFHNEIISYLKNVTGSNRNYRPFWKGFPQEVMEKTETELWMHQIVHYMSNGTYEPNEWTKERSTAFEQPKYFTITAGNEDKFLSIFTDLTSVNNSLTSDDLNVVKYFVSEGYELRFPDTVPFKENLCTLASMGLDVPVKTTTDLLRIAIGMSGGDVSLPKVPAKKIKTNRWSSKLELNPAREAFKFKKFKRSERKFLLGLLEKTNCDVSEAVLKDQRWVRLGEILHPGEYRSQFPKAFLVFNKIRNEKVKSWYGRLNEAFNSSFKEGVTFLSQRPGEFMRRLDWMLRNTGSNTGDKEFILNTFSNIAPKVSNKVLFEAYNHFEGRRKAVTNRTIMVKGARSRTTLPDLPAINESIVNRVQNSIKTAIVSKLSELPTLGKVFVDDKLSNIPLPSNMRSASSGLRPIMRGQRFPIGNKNAKVIRAFVFWFDERGNQDIDLSCIFIGTGKATQHIGWNGRHHIKELGCYSGDVRQRQGACSEYIDIKIDSALKAGYKYAIIEAHNYNGGSFESVTDCVSGYLEIEHAVDGDLLFKPSTIANCTRLYNESSDTIISMIDLETQEFIHLDIDKNGIPVASADFDGLMKAVAPYMEAPKFSLYDLVMMHVEARDGELVDQEYAETSFNFDDYSFSYVDILKLMGI
jgi:hypothetical protein